jgi:hypothetical protein
MFTYPSKNEAKAPAVMHHAFNHFNQAFGWRLAWPRILIVDFTGSKTGSMARCTRGLTRTTYRFAREHFQGGSLRDIATLVHEAGHDKDASWWSSEDHPSSFMRLMAGVGLEYVWPEWNDETGWGKVVPNGLFDRAYKGFANVTVS